jgi:two-component system nitrogen regulation response regulator GlnG
VPVLIRGESGTGKELVARALYHHSRRNDKPFLAINCAAIPETLLESELFGYERGAFTGADRRRIGKFEQADGGTIFLDEIGDMTSATQPRVLRLLQEQRFERLGGNDTIQTDVRIIAATNQDLDAMVATGRFRRDLYYRLKVITIALPPLRDRRQDIPLLTEHFLQRLSRELDKPVRSASPDLLELLANHDWPGNVRELQSTLKHALVRAAGEVLTPACLPEDFLSGRAGPAPHAAEGNGLEIAGLVGRLLRAGVPDIYRHVYTAVDRVMMEEVLRYARGNQLQASELLGISRNTLRAKLRALGMGIEKQLLAGFEHGGQ